MRIIMVFFVLTTFNMFAQSINNYKYVLVPSKFDIFKDDNKYNLNTSTKLLLEKYGFEVFFSDLDIPTELANNRCKSLTADLINDSGLFVTKLKLVLKDCKDNIVYETEFGKSREKEFVVAFTQAFREAAKSFETLKYKYNGENQMHPSKGSTDDYQTDQQKIAVDTNTLPSDNPEVFYFAQPIANGFQIVNSEPRIIMHMFVTSQKNVYIGKQGDTLGVVISNNGKWFFEYYEKTNLVSKPINLRF
jgi:hypothetical protein